MILPRNDETTTTGNKGQTNVNNKNNILNSESNASNSGHNVGNKPGITNSNPNAPNCSSNDGMKSNFSNLTLSAPNSGTKPGIPSSNITALNIGSNGGNKHNISISNNSGSSIIMKENTESDSPRIVSEYSKNKSIARTVPADESTAENEKTERDHQECCLEILLPILRVISAGCCCKDSATEQICRNNVDNLISNRDEVDDKDMKKPATVNFGLHEATSEDCTRSKKVDYRKKYRRMEYRRMKYRTDKLPPDEIPQK